MKKTRDCLESIKEKVFDFLVDSYWYVRYFIGCKVDIEIYTNHHIVYDDKVKETDNFATIFLLNCSSAIVWMEDLDEQKDFAELLNLLKKEGSVREEKDEGLYYSRVKMKALLSFLYDA